MSSSRTSPLSILVVLCLSASFGCRGTHMLLPVISRDGMGYVDGDGTPRLGGCRFEIAKSFSEGVALVWNENRPFFIDRSGDEVVTLDVGSHIWSVGHFSEGLCVVRTQQGSCFITKNGLQAFSGMFAEAHAFSCGRAAVQFSDGDWGYVDRSGRLVSSNRFDLACSFQEGFAHVKIGKKWGTVDLSCEFVLEPSFDALHGPSEGVSVAVAAGSRFHVDHKGNRLFNHSFLRARPFSEGMSCVETGDGAGFIDRTGEFAVEPIYEAVQPFSEGLAAVKVDGRWGFIDHSGNLAVDPRFDEVEPFHGGAARVWMDFEYGYIREDGSKIWWPRGDDD
jgi:hypothetical protein